MCQTVQECLTKNSFLSEMYNRLSENNYELPVRSSKMKMDLTEEEVEQLTEQYPQIVELLGKN